MKVFLDANILFSASLPGSRLAEFLHGLQQHAVFFTNAYALAEAERNISAKAPKQLLAFQQWLPSLKLVPLQLSELKVKLAEKDQPILCGAIAAKADYLLTGDKKDFGHLFGQTVQGVTVVTVELLLQELEQRGYIK